MQGEVTLRGPCHCCQQIQISNLIATKEWWGLIPPTREPAQAGISPHGTRYLAYSAHFHWEDIAFPATGGDEFYSGSFGRYSGCVVSASASQTGDVWPDVWGLIPGTRATVTESAGPGTVSVHYDFYWPEVGAQGTFDLEVSSPYTLEQLKIDCRELYLMRDISNVPANAFETVQWEADGQGLGGVGLTSKVFFLFAADPGVVDYRSSVITIDGAYGGIKPDYRTLSDVIDTSGFALGNSFSQQYQGGQSGLWTMVGTLYRQVGTVQNCVKARVDGNTWDGTTATSVPKDNFVTCFERDTAANHTLYLDAPDIVINYDNNIVDLYWDPFFGKVPSDAGAGCDCISRPQPPFNVQAVSGGAVVVLSWESDPTDHDINFDILRSTTSGAETELQHAFDHSPYVDGFVGVGNTYYYKVRARNAYGVSEFSAEVSITL